MKICTIEQASVACVLLVILTGCGGMRKIPLGNVNPGSSPAPSEQSAQAHPFLLWVLPQGVHPEFPVEEPSQALNREVLTETEEIVFQDTFRVHLPESNPRSLFLVWPEASFGSRIVDAHYEHQIKDSLNRTQGEPDRESASFDAKTQRWFIPFSRFTRGNPVEINPADIHRVTLDLLLSDHTRRRIRVNFKMMGPIPPILLKKLAGGQVKTPLELSSKTAASDGWITSREQLTNPTSRHLALWVRVHSRGTLQLRSQLMHSRYTGHENKPPSGPDFDFFDSVASLQLAELRIFGDQGTSEKMDLQQRPDLDSSGWTKIDFKPFEILTLEWIARAETAVQKCGVPPAETLDVTWMTTTPMRCIRGECIGGDAVFHPRTVTQTWSVVSATIDGSWNRELRLAEAFLSASDVLSETGRETLPVGTQNREEVVAQILVGAPPRLAPRLNCQGLML
jgi:hypothetical protein